jgi:hypothetical protein
MQIDFKPIGVGLDFFGTFCIKTKKYEQIQNSRKTIHSPKTIGSRYMQDHSNLIPSPIPFGGSDHWQAAHKITSNFWAGCAEQIA